MHAWWKRERVLAWDEAGCRRLRDYKELPVDDNYLCAPDILGMPLAPWLPNFASYTGVVQRERGNLGSH